MLKRKAKRAFALDVGTVTSVTPQRYERTTSRKGIQATPQPSKRNVAVGHMKGDINFCELDMFHDNINRKAIFKLTNVSGETVTRARNMRKNVSPSDLFGKDRLRLQQADPQEIQRLVQLQLHNGAIRIQSTRKNPEGDPLLELPTVELLITSTERDPVVTMHEFITCLLYTSPSPRD